MVILLGSSSGTLMSSATVIRLKAAFKPRARLRRVLPLVDFLTAGATALAGAYFYAMRRLGLNEMPLNKRALERIGIWPIRRHYYEPYFDTGMLRQPLDQPRDLPGLELNSATSLGLIDELARFAGESLNEGELVGHEYRHDNGNYGLPDAALLYAMVRHFKPRRMVEVGCGNSTLVVNAALRRNLAEVQGCEHLCIEPYEMPWLEGAGCTVQRKMVEDVDPALFAELDSGDMLFVDNSHMIRPQGDVLTVVQRILPRLKPGVIVHIHDLFTPRDYPQSWLLRDRTMWNEQYLVEAFLTLNPQFEVLFAANHIYVDHRSQFDRLKPALAGQEWHVPTAFWLRRVS